MNPSIAKVTRIIDKRLDISFSPRFSQKSRNNKGLKNAKFIGFLKDLLTMAVTKSKCKSNHAVRYSAVIKKYSTYIYLIGGRKLYNNLSKNIPLPSLKSTQNYIKLVGPNVNEGELRCSELKEYLERNQYPFFVFLSEDATGIIKKAEYNYNNNNISGFVPPLDINGMPLKNSFPATSADVISKYFANEEKSSLIYVVMAQPLQLKAAPFCLLAFGTNNKFSQEHVTSRWKYIIQRLGSVGITVVGIASDGDTRLLRAMRLEMHMNDEPRSYFISTEEPAIFCFQDTVHIITKLRTRLLKTNMKPLVIGTYMAEVNHLEKIIETTSKSEHLLVKSDLNLADKMNFASAKKNMLNRSFKAYGKK